MDLQPPTGPLPELFAAVRRRHPDADIVLLPEEPAAPDADAVSEADVGAALGRVTTTADLHWSRVVGEVGEARARFRFGPGPGDVVADARHEAPVAEELAPLERLQGQLDECEWHSRRLSGRAGRLVAERDGLRLRAAYAPSSGTFLLEVTSDPLHVGAERAGELVRR
jgi:hypothetical protein